MLKPAMRLAVASIFLLLLASIGHVFGQSGASIDVATHPEYGDHLVDGSGKALYLFTEDPPNESTCLARCGQTWPPLIASGDITAGEGVDPELLGTVEREDGITQVTYAGSPVYKYIVDSAGDAGGQGADGSWYLIDPSGEPIGAETSDASVDGGALPFTAEQASRGEAAYGQHCAGCHQANLAGSFEAPELAGPNFRNYWGGRQVSELFNFASNTMPLGNPGGLDDATYADILAYIFQENGFDASGESLASEADALQDLTIPSSN